MRRVLTITMALVVLAGGGVAAANVRHGDRPGRALVATPVLTGLDWPAAFTFAPDGRIFYGERYTGTIDVYDPSNGTTTPFYRISHVVTDGEQGLLGLALDPRWPSTPVVYAYATRSVNGTLRNQILRITGSEATGTSARIIFSSDTVAGSYHDGGRILFGPDRRLYAVVGEGHDPSNAQDLSVHAGKVLRMTTTGAAPADNPFAGSLIFTYGLRNSIGFTFDPVTRLLWETENGPECNDEINVERAGENHGWGPSETCSTPPAAPANTNQDGPNPVMPLRWFTPTIAPTGTAFCDACGLTGSDGDLFFATWNTGLIRRAVLTGDRAGIASISTVYSHGSGIVSMERAPGGALYFSDATGIYRLTNG